MTGDISEGRQFLKSNWSGLEGVRSDQIQGVAVPDIQKPVPEGSEIFDLIKPDDLPLYERTVHKAIADRESRRKYKGTPIEPEEISFLLWATQGIRKLAPHYSRRSVPSAGARHSLETYIYADRVTGIPPGLYRYLVLDHQLCKISDAPDLAPRLDDALHRQRWNSAATFIWTTIPYRMEWRYSFVSHKLIALDAGHICQNLYTACEAIECGTCAIGAYDQKLLDAVIGVDGVDEFAVYVAPVGKV